MRIGIDISRVIEGSAGIGVYTKNLVHGLSKIDNKNEYILYPYFWECFPATQYNKTIFPQNKNFVIYKSKFPTPFFKYLWNTNNVSKENLLNIKELDIVHSLAYTVPVITSVKKKLVVTIYDLTFFLHPEWHTIANRKFCITQCLRAIRYADKIITVSFCSKKDIIEILHIQEEKIKVIYGAADEIYKPIEDKVIKEEILRKYNLIDKNFLLFVGSIEPRKNLKTLIYAFNKLFLEYKDIYLVVISSTGWLNTDVYNLIQELKIGEKIIFLNKIPSEELPIFYNLAKIFIYPSLYEGFGLPVLEAMQCGTPVITSNTSSLKEIAENATITIEPTNAELLTEKMYQVLTDSNLQNKLKDSGIRKAKEFSWIKTAKETLEVYEEIFND